MTEFDLFHHIEPELMKSSSITGEVSTKPERFDWVSELEPVYFEFIQEGGKQ